MRKSLTLKLVLIGSLMMILGGLSYLEYVRYQKEYQEKPKTISKETELASFRNVEVKEDILTSLTNMCKSAGRDHVELKMRYGYLSDEEEMQMLARDDQFDTGLQIDFYSKIAGKNERMWEWLEKHAHQYGFILRYPEGKETTTNHEASPSIYRYVGVSLATTMKEQNLCLEEL